MRRKSEEGLKTREFQCIQARLMRMETEKEGLVRWQEHEKPREGWNGREEKAC